MVEKKVSFYGSPSGRHSSSSRKQSARHSRGRAKKPGAINLMLFFPLTIIFLECVFQIGVFKSFINLYTIMFSISCGLILMLISTLFSKKTNRIVTLVVLGLVTVLFGFHYVYDRFFPDLFVWSSLGEAGNFTDFYREIFAAILKNLGGILIICIPFFLYLALGERIAPAYRANGRARVLYVVMIVAVHLLTILFIAFSPTANSFYRGRLDAKEVGDRFGLITLTRIDIGQALFGPPDEKVDKPTGDLSDFTDEDGDKGNTTPNKPIKIEDQVMDIDFDSLIAGEKNKTIKDMHEYFAGLTPTQTNEYTGMFEGKNLIFLTLEGFSNQVIDPELTPTLYKMATEGFVFENFYTGVWGGSTATGEYAATSGNFYNSANCLRMAAETDMPFALGNQFKKEGYLTLAYHNHTHTYYGRDKSHPNMGYTFKAIGNGLTLASNSWPRSDIEMGEATIGDYIDSDKPFHVYYMTVSGHANYSWAGNNMCKKHRSEVQHLPYSENVKAYIACQLEVEYMLTDLIEKLDAAGKLEDTVFAMSADHFPYALTDSELAELYDLPEDNIRANFDLYRNGFILWSAGMEKPVRISKPASSIDIIPTLSNLFGLEYDSRLLMGTDILSSTDPVVILNTEKGGSWHWITASGSYNTKKKEFTPAAGIDWDETKQKDYVKLVNQIVAAKRAYSFKILDNDYYSHVF